MRKLLIWIYAHWTFANFKACYAIRCLDRYRYPTRSRFRARLPLADFGARHGAFLERDTRDYTLAKYKAIEFPARHFSAALPAALRCWIQLHVASFRSLIARRNRVSTSDLPSWFIRPLSTTARGFVLSYTTAQRCIYSDEVFLFPSLFFTGVYILESRNRVRIRTLVIAVRPSQFWETLYL